MSKIIRNMIDISEVRHATSMTLRSLNAALSNLPEHAELKNACRQELKKRKNGR